MGLGDSVRPVSEFQGLYGTLRKQERLLSSAALERPVDKPRAAASYLVLKVGLCTESEEGKELGGNWTA